MTPFLPRREWLRATWLALAAVGVWLLAQGGGIDVRVPAAYSVDALETLTRFKLSAERGASLIFDPVAPRLGAPWGADWSAYPLPDALWYWGIGRLVNALGLMPASYLALALAHVLATLAFYLCARVLRHRVAFAVTGALVFGFCYSLFQRGLSHHSFALIFPVPLTLLSVWLVGGSRLWLERRSAQIFCIGTGAIVGAGNPYFVFLYLQLLGLGLLYQGCTARRSANLRTGAAAAVAATVVFLVVNYPTLAAQFRPESASFARNYSATEVYGLKPIELFVPPPNHRWEAAAGLGRLYGEATRLSGEHFMSYAGITGALAIAATLTIGLAALLRSRRPLRPAHLPLFFWIVAFGMVGGINSVLALCGFDFFRASNRYSVHLLALALFFLSAWATRRTRRWPPVATWGVALPLMVIALWDQLPLRPQAADRAAMSELVEGDRRAAAALEQALPAGAMLFQLPVVQFPEAGPRLYMSDYEHARLFLHSSHLRFSYGAMPGSDNLRWAAWAAALPPRELVTELERAGFQGLLIDRRAFADRANALDDELSRAGYTSKPIAGAPHLALVVLRVAKVPVLPDPDAARLHEPWGAKRATTDAITVHAVQGWFALENEGAKIWRWATNHAVTGLWNPMGAAMNVQLSFGVRATGSGTLALQHNDREVWRGSLPTDSGPIALRLILPPQSSRLTWRFSGRPVRIAPDSRKLGFAIENLSVTAVP